MGRPGGKREREGESKLEEESRKRGRERRNIERGQMDRQTDKIRKCDKSRNCFEINIVNLG